MPHFPVTLWEAGNEARLHMYTCELGHQSQASQLQRKGNCSSVWRARGKVFSFPGRGFARLLGTTLILCRPVAI